MVSRFLLESLWESKLAGKLEDIKMNPPFSNCHLTGWTKITQKGLRLLLSSHNSSLKARKQPSKSHTPFVSRLNILWPLNISIQPGFPVTHQSSLPLLQAILSTMTFLECCVCPRWDQVSGKCFSLELHITGQLTCICRCTWWSDPTEFTWWPGLSKHFRILSGALG